MSSMAVPHSTPVIGAAHRGSGLRPAPGADPVDDDLIARWSRRIVLAVGVAAVAVMVVAGVRIVVAHQSSAALVDGVAGHVVAGPGEGLADVAARTLPAGADPARYLATVEALNERTTGSSPSGSRVVLLPGH